MCEKVLECGYEQQRTIGRFSQAQRGGSILQSRLGVLGWSRDRAVLRAALASARAQDRTRLLNACESAPRRRQAILGGPARQDAMGTQRGSGRRNRAQAGQHARKESAVQRYFPVPAGSPAAAFRDIASNYPVFELLPA